MVVPSWQQIPPQHAAIQQPLLSDAGDWGRPLIVDSSTILQEHRPVFPVDVATEVYDPSLVDHHPNHHSSTAMVNASGSWTNKRGVSKTSHQHNLVCPPQQQQQQQPQLQHVSQPTHHHHHHHHHHLTVPNHRSQQDAKKEPTQLSPVKKRVKEGTPPSDSVNGYNTVSSSRRRHSPVASSSTHWQQHHQGHSSVVQQTGKHHSHTIQQHMEPHLHQSIDQASQQSQQVVPGRQQTITIHDTPSPAVSVITISDSEDEAPGKCCKDRNCSACYTSGLGLACHISSNCSSVLTVASQDEAYHSSQSTPSRGVSARQRKNVISCVTVGDSDGEEHRSPAKHQLQQVYQHQQQPPQVSASVHTPGHTVREIKHEPQHSYSGGASQSQKKRLLAKAQSECMLGVATKREPGLSDYHHPADYVHHSSCHGKEPALVASNSVSAVAPGYHYVTTSSAGGHSSTNGQDQHIVYTGCGEKRGSWAPPTAHTGREMLAPPSAHKRDSVAVPVSSHREYHIPQQGHQPQLIHAAGVHKEYIQPPAAHTTREAIAVSTREQHLLAAAQAKTWTTATASGAHPALHQGYRHSSAHLSPQPLAHAAAASRLSPQHPLAAAGQPLYHQPELYRRPAVYVTTTQPAYLPASHQVAPFTAGRALPPPAHHASARPVLATHPTHPLPAHMQPAAVFPAHPQVAASYGFAPLSPAKSHQYQPSLWFTE